MSRKGYWRQIQREAGSRTETEQQKKKQSNEERGGGRAALSVSLSLLPGYVAACFLPLNFPSWRKSTVWRKTLEWWTTKLNLSHSGLPPVGTTLHLGIDITKPYRDRKHSDRPRIIEEWSLSRGKLTHSTQSHTNTVICVLTASQHKSVVHEGTVKSTHSALDKHTACWHVV